MKKKKFLYDRPIAHRGIHYNYIENTMPAFRSAVIRGYTIELDVRFSKDKQVVVFHDDSLLRIKGINKLIRDLTYEELTQIMDIPLLKDVLEMVKGRVPLIIELKYDRSKFKLEEAVAKLLDNYNYEFTVQSFNPITVLWFRINRNNYIRGYLVSNTIYNNAFIKNIFNSKLLKKIIAPDYIAPNLKFLTSKKIKQLRATYLILGYTINTQEEYDKYNKYADNLICNIGKKPYKKTFK